MQFAVGITTAPRERPTFAECYQSVLGTGFTSPYVFADAYTPPGVEDRLVVRPNTLAKPVLPVVGTRYGAWRNWLQSLADLLHAEPDAEGILLVQDDVRFCRGVKDFLADGHWRLSGSGLVALSLSFAYRGIAQNRGLNDISINRAVLAGAWALLFPREVAQAILVHPLCQDAPKAWHTKFRDPVMAKGIDSAVGRILLQMGYKFHAYRPSLAQHFGEASTINTSGPLTGNRATHSWHGVEAVAADLFRVPVVT